MKNDKDDTKKKSDDTKETEHLKLKIEELENQLKRALADYQNLEKRVAESRRELILSANKQLLLKLLPIVDTLEMAAKHSDDQSLKVSVQLFLDTLKQSGVTKIETIGKSFDPNTMECIATEEGIEGKVLKEHRAGYVLYDKVLRPAQVSVGKGE